MFAALSYPVTIVLLLATTGLAVLVVAVLEARTPERQWRDDARPVGSWLPGSLLNKPLVGEPQLGEAVLDRAVAAPGRTESATLHVQHRTPRPAPGAPRPRFEAPIPEPIRSGPEETSSTGRSSPVLVLSGTGSDSGGVPLGGLGSDRDLAGVLFAAYVASGGDEASRVTGWVSPCGNPPAIPDLHSGDHLRGRVTRVLELLACSDDGANWIMLDPRTDIGMAVARKAPTDPVLVGLVAWWRLATLDSHTIAPTDAAVVAAAIDWVSGALVHHPLGGLAQDVRGMALEASLRAEGLRVSIEAVGHRRDDTHADSGHRNGAEIGADGTRTSVA